MAAPRTLAKLRAMPPGPARVRAIKEFIAMRDDEIKEARKLRNEDVRALATEHGPAEAARMLGMPLPTVKAIKGNV